jgi:hypothetical protein
MTIYVDENLSPFLIRGFNILQAPLNHKLKEHIQVVSIKDEFGLGAKDEEWIPVVGDRGGCVITCDYNIHRIRHQRQLTQDFSLGLFYFRPPSKNGWGYWDILTLFVKTWPQVTRIATSEDRPFEYCVSARAGISRME